MRPRNVLLILLVLVGTARGEDEPVRLEETVVTPARRREPLFTVPFSTSVIRAPDLSGARAPRSLPDALSTVPGVMVQKTGYGQGSPYLRGLTGFRTLLLVDGIRLNHSAFRAGPNQYASTVDHLSLRRTEVVRGPSSVLYGSDAMGGALNFLPRVPLRDGGVYPYRGRIYQRFASAERSSVTRVELQGGVGPDFGFLAGLDRKVFGDLRAGDGLLRETGYDEWDGDVRLSWSPETDLTLTLAYQRVSQSDVPRTHKTIYSRPWHGTVRGSERRRELDQTRDLLFFRVEVAEELAATLSWHRHRETRHRVRGDGRSDRQGFTVNALGIGVQATSETSAGTLAYGFDAYRDHVDSFSRKFDAAGKLTSEGIQGPVADDAVYDLVGAYLQDEIALGSGLALTAGVRATYARADAGATEDPATGKRISISDRFRALVGSARISWLGMSGVNAYGGVSQGFRAPNLSDLTRLDSARSNEIETPSPGLDRERALTFEIGAKVELAPVSGEVVLFHTELDDLIQRFPTGRLIDGDAEITKANVGDGYVRGFEISGEVDLGSGLTAFGGGAYYQGKADTFPTSRRKKSREHLDRLPPLSGQVGLRWRGPEGLFSEVRVRMADKADRLSPRDRADTQRIPPGGTPGYAVLDLTVSYPVRPGATVTLAVANIAGRDWRVHGSGQNEPGRNVSLTVEFEF